MASKITSHGRESRRAATHIPATHTATTHRSSYVCARQNPAAARKSKMDGSSANAITTVPVRDSGVFFPMLRPAKSDTWFRP